ncbi:MAG: hypothetical protein QXO21_00350 [Candidatus Anstonellales archaeon]
MKVVDGSERYTITSSAPSTGKQSAMRIVSCAKIYCQLKFLKIAYNEKQSKKYNNLCAIFKSRPK